MKTILTFALLFGLGSLPASAGEPGKEAAAPATASGPPLRCEVAWLGNTGAGGSTEAHIAWAAEDLFVAPDGTLCANTSYDEGLHCGTLFGPDGQKIGYCQYPMWASTGGAAVTADERYMYLAMEQRNSGEPQKTWYPPKNEQWFGVRRYPLKGAFRREAVEYPGGLGPSNGERGEPKADGSLLVVSVRNLDKKDAPDAVPVEGLAALKNELYVSDPKPGDSRIKVYALPFDGQKMTRSWPVVDGASRIRFDSQGGLWVLKGRLSETAQLLRYSTRGELLPQRISFPGGVKPSNFCIDKDDRLLVMDQGPAQNIRIYVDITTTPRLHGTFGVPGGVFAGTPGAAGPQRFFNPSAIATDGTGNIHVASSGGGATLEKYAPNGSRVWSHYNLAYQVCADFDPASETDVYLPFHHFVVDYDRMKPGSLCGTHKGVTVNPLKYPDDPRGGYGSPNLFRVRGTLFMLDYQWSDARIYRFGKAGEGECAVWCVHFDNKGKRIWRDLDGNGKKDDGEFEAGVEFPFTCGLCVGDDGSLWYAGQKRIVRFPCEGLDGVGTPVYRVASKVEEKAPEDFSELLRIQYDAAADTVYLSGRTPAVPDDRDWRSAGTVMRKYPNWKGGNRKSSWTARLVQEGCPTTVSLAGDYLFVANTTTFVIHVHRTSDGSSVGRIECPKEIAHGWYDMTAGSIKARQRANGEYVILAEEQWCGKLLVFRWRPEATPAVGAGTAK